MCTIASHTVLLAAPCSSPRCANRLPGAQDDQRVAGGETMGKHRKNGDFTQKFLGKIVISPRQNWDFMENWLLMYENVG